MMAKQTPSPGHQRLYGRRKGHVLTPRRQALIDDLLPTISPVIGEDGQLDLKGPVVGLDRLWLEVGFGGGEHLAWQAKQHPEITVIGAEPFLNGVASLLAHIEDEKLTNVRIIDDDVRPFLEAMPTASLERIMVLYPDPWPKLRHNKRRIVNTWSVDRFADLLIDGGELRLATDIMDYARWMMAAVWRHPDLVWTARRPCDWKDRPKDWPETRYEAKARKAGRPPVYLTFKRQSR
jgi:tRNA (guanine-N7-)-methyltransferase